jgi:chromosome segregation ATPase
MNDSKKGCFMGNKNYASNMVRVLIMTLALGSFAHAESISTSDKDAAVDVQSDVESLQANFDDAEGGLATSGKELREAKVDLINKTRENHQTVAKLKNQIQNLNAQQAANTKETARLTGNIVQLTKEIRKYEASHMETKAKADIVMTKLMDVKASYDQSVANRQKIAANLKSVQDELKKNQLALKQKQTELKASSSKETASKMALKKSEDNLKKMEITVATESKKMDQQIRTNLALAEKNERIAKQNEVRRAKLSEQLKNKQQRLAESKQKIKKSNRIGSN